MAVLPPVPLCPHGVPADRFVPCAVCDPAGYRVTLGTLRPATDLMGPKTSMPDVDSRLRRLEAVVAYAERPIFASGFELLLPAARPDAPDTGHGYGEADQPYLPIEAEFLHGYSLEPTEGVWVVNFQIGRRHFLNSPALAKADMRRLCVTVDPATGRADAVRIFPTTGAVLRLQNRAPAPRRVRGAFLVEQVPWVSDPPRPLGMGLPGVAR